MNPPDRGNGFARGNGSGAAIGTDSALVEVGRCAEHDFVRLAPPNAEGKPPAPRPCPACERPGPKRRKRDPIMAGIRRLVFGED